MEQKINPEAREEDIALSREANNALDWIIIDCTKPFRAGAKSQKAERQERAVNTIRLALSRLAAQKDEGQDWRLGDRWEGGIKPIASEPRPDDDGIAYRNPTDTIHNHSSVSQNNGKEE